MLVAIDLHKVGGTSRLPIVSGSYEQAVRGEGVVISDNFALMRGYSLGDTLAIPTPKGLLRLPVTGIVIDFSDQMGSVFLEHTVYVKWWNDDRFNIFRVFVEPAASREEVRHRILNQFAAGRRLFVMTNEELRSYIMKITDQWFGITYVQIAVAVLVAILGIVNSLTVSIADRRRELGVLQAVGGLRNQVRHTIWLEALAIGVIGLALGLMLGAVQLFYSLEVARRDLAGMRLDYTYPVEIAVMLLPAILGSAFIAAIGPAESAVRGSLVEALEYE
jgi:putative ABC transport system permease protein